MKIKTIFTLIFLALALQVWGDFRADFLTQFENSQDTEQQKEVIQKFLKQANSTEDHRIVQSY